MTALAPIFEERCGTRASHIEEQFAELLAGVLGLDHVPVDGHFFEQLGADSLRMAQFCARARKRGDLPPVSIPDVYAHPTIRSLTAALLEAAPRAARAPALAPTPTSPWEYAACGALQLLFLLGYSYLAVTGAVLAYAWIFAGVDAAQVYLRLVASGAAAFVVVCATPILAKWVLIGRWKPGQIRLWSLGYVRFWLVKTLIRSNPCALLFVGSPLYVLYLRALGAKIGSGVVIFSRRIPVCTDLLAIGAGTVIRREAFFQCYRAHAGRIEIGPVTLGRGVFVGERTVLDIHTSMGDGAQLGHASSLHSGQAILAGERWHGSPGRRAAVNYRSVAPLPRDRGREFWFSAGTLLLVLLVYLPLVEGSPYLLRGVAPALANVLDPGEAGSAVTTFPALVTGALQLSLLLFFGAVLIGLPLVVALPRALNRLLEPDRVYPLYGVHDRVQRAIARLSRIRFFVRLFGDSSYVVPYLQGLGYRLSPVEQTGSNFGLTVMQGNPGLCSVGAGTMVADGLEIINDEVSSTSFGVTRAAIGPRNFLGNDVAYPAGGRAGDNCLLATKVLVPLDGPIREGVGLLGSPSFQIPRTVDRDTRFDHLRSGEALRRGLAAKDRYNLRTMGIFLIARWLGFFLVTLLDVCAFAWFGVAGHAAAAGLLAASLLITPLYFVLVERCIAGFRPLEPTYCSIYDRYFWLYERLWKVPALDYLHSFDGTPYKTVIWRLMGVRIGRRVFDDGVHIADRTLATVGDDCVLNNGSKIQCHSQEDGTFKADRATIGAGCTIGVGALVHYGVTMGDGSALAPDSFLMKGEEVPARAQWGGNPAREL